MTPEQLQTIKSNTEQSEGRIPWLYRDNATEGNATCGIGHLVPDLAHAQQLPFQPSITAQEWARLASEPRGCRASFYQSCTLGRLSSEAIDALLDADLAASERDLARQFAAWNEFPGPAQAALLDMRFNLGSGGFAKFTHLICAAKLRDWGACARECHRMGISEARNQETAALFTEAAKSGGA